MVLTSTARVWKTTRLQSKARTHWGELSCSQLTFLNMAEWSTLFLIPTKAIERKETAEVSAISMNAKMHESRTRIAKDTGSCCECGRDPSEHDSTLSTDCIVREKISKSLSKLVLFSLNKIVECLWKRLPCCSK